MKKLLLLCSLVFAINASAVEMPTQERLDAILQEHVALLAQTPIENRTEITSEWLMHCNAWIEKLQDLMTEKGPNHPEVQQLHALFLQLFALPLNKAIMQYEGFSAEEKMKAEESVNLINMILSIPE